MYRPIRLLNVGALGLDGYYTNGDVVDVMTRPDRVGRHRFRELYGYLTEREFNDGSFWEYLRRPTVGGI